MLPFFFPLFIPSKTFDHTSFEKEIATLKIKTSDSSNGSGKRNYDDNEPPYYHAAERNYYTRKPSGELFYFDPNTITAGGWKKLGLKDRTIETIQKYISKGGKFYKPADISKIWGLHEDEVQRLIPYIKIERSAHSYVQAENNSSFKTYEKPNFSSSAIDINAADTSAFIALPGIGSKLANRIIAFRDKLGGFYRIEQVSETFGLADSVFQKIKGRLTLTTATVKKLNINSATVEELKSHPYLRYNIANAIVQYRVQHGAFTSLNDIRKIMMITEELYNKAAPYLSVQ
jgi:competence protein ComEA